MALLSLSFSQLPVSHQQTFWDLQPGNHYPAIDNWLAQNSNTIFGAKRRKTVCRFTEVQQYLMQHYFADQAVAVNGVHYQFQQSDANDFPTIEMRPAQSVQDNFAQRYWVKCADYLSTISFWASVATG